MTRYIYKYRAELEIYTLSIYVCSYDLNSALFVTKVDHTDVSELLRTARYEN